VFGAPPVSRALWAVDVRSLETGEVLFTLNPDRLVMPASNMKIVTMAAAAERLGWDYRFETTLVSAAPVRNGVLEGDLVIVGSGDPSINERDGRAAQVFDEWAAALRAAGVEAIAGRLVADDRAFETERLGAGWSWDDLAYGYAAPVSALQFGEDLVTLTVTPGATPGAPATVTVAPDTSGLVVESRVATGAAESRLSLDLQRLPGQRLLRVTGTVPAGSHPATRTASVDDPAEVFARATEAALTARGIEVREGIAVAGRAADTKIRHEGERVLVRSLSPPLADIGAVLMKASQNLYAETLLRALSHEDGRGSIETGRRAVGEVLERWGLDTDALVQYDGSGLSRYNYVTASLVVGILSHLYGDARHREPFLATLPVGGRDGTISGRFRDTRAAGNVRAKTGSIANVRALSGYVTTLDSEDLVFSIIANHFTVPSSLIDHATDTAVERLATFSRR
jgi:D-alanyl-D-alanine carboxypeptidase/D-alanyl-D-alanine-endopeptidase (penicillin-binding protein 4)